MTRKKVKLTYITNDSARKATFKKRKMGLMKKVRELTTLCDIDACAIIYSPYDSQPEVWPSHLGAQRELTMSDLTDLNWVIDQHLKEIQLRMKNINNKAMESPNHVQGAQGLPATRENRMPAMKTNSEGSNNNTAMKSGEEGSIMQHATLDMQAFDQMHSMEAIQPKMMQMVTQKPQNSWFMDMMNAPAPSPHQDHHQHMGFREEMMFPFADHDNSTMWPNPPAGGNNFP
ncbi:hypothetical protein ACLB2K_067496 [Fragaria x ananassa]